MTDQSSAENMLYSTMRFLAKKVTRQKKVRFREFLVRAGLITDEQLEQRTQNHVLRARGTAGNWSTAPNQDGSETRSEVQSHLSTQTVLTER